MEKDPKLFDYIFNPRTVAVIGASPNDIATRAQMQTKLKDRLFFVNPKYKEVMGKQCYPGILDIPKEIDYVIIVIGQAAIPAVLEDCIRKGVKVAQIFSAGYSETGIPEAIEREKALKEQAAGRIRLIGPNCLGVYCPRSGLAIVPEAPTDEGHISVLAQSGSVTEFFSYFAVTKNLRFSKMVSYGNAIDLDGADFLDYLADDPDTKIIAVYIEGAKDPARLSAALSKAARKKPVIAIKGGMTEQGMRAASSHTAAMAGSPDIWKGVFKQTGVLQVNSFDEMVNTVIAFDKTAFPAGRRAALVTNSGGFSVIQLDLCVSLGIEVPRFSDATIDALQALVPRAGTSIGNPLDAWPIFYNVAPKGNVADIIEIVAMDEGIDTLVFHFDQFRYLRRIIGPDIENHMDRLIDLMVEGCERVRDKVGKPVFVSIYLDPYLEDVQDRFYNLTIKKAFVKKGFPVYASLDGAMMALANLYRYAERQVTGDKK
ncbi:MAG: CoA-binding protein [Deltaproteobacteria bacterium]|nr:CoA-binding protein [Deltaproteobacteria bacterium]